MSVCPSLSGNGTTSVSLALRAIDCEANRAVEVSFSRLFGGSGTLSQALTLTLTIYVALFAISLITGYSRLRLSMLTPRMLQLGLALTFATSWVAYQNVVWNLLVGAPDAIASQLLGTDGSATQIFAARIDSLFNVLIQSAQMAQGANAVSPAPGSILPAVSATSAKPADLLWAASLLLLLGTVGVLVVARIALAAIIAIGPIFVILSLFRGTHGLFEGWLKIAIMLALTPVLAVFLGGGVLAMFNPMITSLAHSGGKVSLGLATSVFLAAFVYLALMIVALRMAQMLTAGWQLGHWAQLSAQDTVSLQTQRSTTAELRASHDSAELGQTSNDNVRDPRLYNMIRSARAPMLTGVGYESALLPGSALVQIVPVDGGGLTDRGTRDPRIRPISQAARAGERILP